MKKVGTALMAILILTSVLIVPIVHARKGQVTVRVIDTDNKGKERKIKGASVTLYPIASPETTETDKKGRAVFTGLLPNMIYTITVTLPDGTIHTQMFTTNKNGAAPQQTIDI